MSLIDRLLRRRGTGCLKHSWPKGTPDIDKLGLCGVESAGYDSVDLTVYHNEILDQARANSCILEAFANSTDITETRAGVKYVPVSTYAGYYWGRYMSGLQDTDGGAFPADCIEALRRLGICDYQYWPRDYSRINDQPRPDAYMNAHPRRDGKYVVIMDAPKNRMAPIRAAMDAGHTVNIPLLIDRAFQSDSGTFIIGPPTGSIIGGHMQCQAGYRYSDVFRQWVLKNIGSYGKRWKNGGYCEVTEEYICSPYAGAPIIIYGWQRLQECV